MNIIVSNNKYCDPNEFTKVCSSIDELYKALCEAYDKQVDDHIHIEFCNVDSVGNNVAANYSAIIDHRDVTRYNSLTRAHLLKK